MNGQPRTNRCEAPRHVLVRWGNAVRRTSRRIAGESGQGMTEYIILVLLVSVLLIPMFRIFPEAIRGYVRPFYYCISRPIP